VEVLLQWIDELDDLMVAGGQLALAMGYRLAALASLGAAGLAGVGVGLGIGMLWG
jgi:hypothetical protein